MLVSIHHSQFETQHKPMKRSIFAGRLKNTVLAIPACALMLGAAQAGTTIGLNFQAWYYDSGSNPQTIGFGFGYQTTGFPVTGRAFGVSPANWWNTDPLPAQAPISSGSTLFGSTASEWRQQHFCRHAYVDGNRAQRVAIRHRRTERRFQCETGTRG